MKECSVCKKPIPDSATECSVYCLSAASKKAQGGIMRAQSSFNESMRKMFEPDDGGLLKPPEEPKLKVKHRWMRNRNIVRGSVVFSFNHEGVAIVPDVAKNRAVVEQVVKSSKGLIEWVVEKPVKVEPEPVKEKVEEPKAKAKKAEPKEEKKPAKKTVGKKKATPKKGKGD
jgi:hypothetical protein